MSEKKILVPVDFTDVSMVAVGHAHHLAKRTDSSLHVMHLVKDTKDIEAGQYKLEEFLTKVNDELGRDVSIQTEVKVGDILKDIGETAEAMEVSMVVIGTHGLQGMEYIVGTHAVRIVSTAQVPFIVVQEKPIDAAGYDNIIMPMDLHSESKQKLDMVARMAKLFDATVHLVIPHEGDEFLQNALTRNLNFAKDFFKNHSVDYTATQAEEDSGDLDKALFKLSEEKKGDLIAIMNWHDTRFLGIFGSDITQDVIINKAMTPVLVLNPKAISNFDLMGHLNPV